MISLSEYNEYWRGVASRVGGIGKVVSVAADEDMSLHLGGLSNEECPVLFVVVPESTGSGDDVDSYTETCDGVVLLGDKYDPQRSPGAVGALERLQPLVEELKATLMGDCATGCPVIRGIRTGSVKMAPVTNLYGDFAGWMVSFEFE